MQNTLILHKLQEVLQKSCPPKTNLADEVGKILSLEKASVYRRLRGDTPFSFAEIALITQKLRISLDQLTLRHSPEEKIFVLPFIDYINPSVEDFVDIDSHLQAYKNILKNGYTAEAVESCNSIPATLYYKYENITRLYILKWLYQYKSSSKPPLYKEVIIEDRLRKTQLEHYTLHKKAISQSHYIFDNLLLYYTVNTVKYFSDINLINPKEEAMIKEELLLFLEEIEQIALDGKDPVTGNEIFLYVSHLNLDTNYLYLKTEDWQLTAIKLFQLSYAGSLEKETFETIKTWIESLKRHSILISTCNEVQCRTFLERQRKFVKRISQ